MCNEFSEPNNKIAVFFYTTRREFRFELKSSAIALLGSRGSRRKTNAKSIGAKSVSLNGNSSKGVRAQVITGLIEPNVIIWNLHLGSLVTEEYANNAIQSLTFCIQKKVVSSTGLINNSIFQLIAIK